jgi:hypothetical protein
MSTVPWPVSMTMGWSTPWTRNVSSTVRPLMPGMCTSSTMAPMLCRSNCATKTAGSAQVCTRRPTVPISRAKLWRTASSSSIR